MNKTDKPKKVVSLIIEIDKLNKIYAMADKYNIGRSQFLRNIIDSGFEEAVALESAGVLPALNFGVNLFRKLKDSLKSGSYSLSDRNDKITFSIK